LSPRASRASFSAAAALLLALASLSGGAALSDARLPTNPFCVYESNVDVIRADLVCVNGAIDSVTAFYGKPGGACPSFTAVAHCSDSPGGYAPATSPSVGAGYYMLQPVINGAVQPFGLRHCTGIASFDADPNGGDFLWRVTEGEDDDRAGISLQPNNYVSATHATP